MLRLFFFTALGGLVLWILVLSLCFRRSIEKAKKTGLPYIIAPFWSVGYLWIFLAMIVAPILQKFSFTKSWKWLSIITPNESWCNLRAAEEKFGDTYLVVSPTFHYLKTSNAELIRQVTNRRNDFIKPVDKYTIVDIFGRSILTQEGQQWRRHRKIVGPSFSEKSNKLVFEESLRQTDAMLSMWSSQSGNSETDLKIEDTTVDAAHLSLHVICAAGFGVPQLWDGEPEEKLKGTEVPGFSGSVLIGEHKMTLKDSLISLLRGFLWFALLEPWHLNILPFQSAQDTYQAFSECKMYFHELLELKKKELYLGESDKGTMDLMGPMIKASEEAPMDAKSGVSESAKLSKEEIIGNAFIFLFAGHETTANSIHYSLLQLAISLASQRHMQADIDKVVGDKPTSDFDYYTDMPRLYHSMVGAVELETLRLVPAVLNIPKVCIGNHTVSVDSRQLLVWDKTFVHLNIVGTNRNPRYWPDSPDEFVPERWLRNERNRDEEDAAVHDVDELDRSPFELSSPGSLFKPVKGSFLSFSEGPRACPGRRFAQVEITAVLAAIFQKYSIELDVSDWASDGEVLNMGEVEKRAIYEKAIERAKMMIRRSVPIITLQMKPGDKVPVRFVARGKERFRELL